MSFGHGGDRRRLAFFHDDGLKRVVADSLRVLRQRFEVLFPPPPQPSLSARPWTYRDL